MFNFGSWIFTVGDNCAIILLCWYKTGNQHFCIWQIYIVKCQQESKQIYCAKWGVDYLLIRIYSLCHVFDVRLSKIINHLQQWYQTIWPIEFNFIFNKMERFGDNSYEMDRNKMMQDFVFCQMLLILKIGDHFEQYRWLN